MPDRLKGRVMYGRTINLGKWNKMEIGWEEDFWLDEKTSEQAFEELRNRIDAWRAKNHI